MKKVLIADRLSSRAGEILRAAGLEVEEAPGLAPEVLAERLRGVHGLAVRSATRVTAELLDRAPDLEVVGRAGIGVDNIDIPAATQRGVVVMNTPYGNTVTTAEHAIALLFALVRQVPAADRSTQAGKWEKSRFMGSEIAGKTLGVIGCGNVGAVVCARARGLAMRVLVFDPFVSESRARDLGAAKVEFETLLGEADFITLHTPLTDQTRGMIDADAIARMKPGVRIVNCARGGLVVEADLCAALDSGHVAGAAFDVFEVEPARESVLFGRENVVATPHVGASTAEAQENVAVEVAEQIAAFLNTGAVVNALNAPSVTAEEAPRLKPYMGLADALGRFVGQICDDAITGIDIAWRGDMARLNTRPLSGLVLQGVLSSQLDSVNMVNAPLVARERGIDLREISTGEADGYRALIEVTAAMGERSRTVAGTLFGDRLRLVRVQDIHFEASFGRIMLFVRNHDRPGVIGKIGTILGEEGVNIANFHLGRPAAGGQALALVEIDEDCPERALDRIAALSDTIARPLILRF